jgi:type I restriction enzyme S subunit
VIENTNELPSLPKNWVWARLEEIGVVASGGTPSTSVPEYFDGDVPWITPVDLSKFSGKLIQRGRRNISEKGLRSSSAVLLPAGTILFSSRAPIGYVAIAANPVATNQGFKNLILHEGIFNEYVFYYLKASKKLAESYGSGTTFREVSASRFRLIPIPLPPYNEQRRIVARLEELFTRLDAGVEGLRKVKAQLKRYRQAVLKYAFEGKMTEEWRKTHKDQIEPATKLLERIKQERREKLGTKYKELPPIDESELPRLPDDWIWTSIKEVGFLVTKGSTPTSYRFKYVDQGINFVKVENMMNGKIIKDSIHEFITQDTHEFLRRSQLVESDILFSIAGTIGRVAIVHKEDLPANINQAIAIVRCPWQFINPKYLETFLESDWVRLSIQKKLRGVGMNNIGLEDVKSICFPLPPLAEQDKIVESIDRDFSFIDETEKVITQSLELTGHLRRSILNSAFKGKLVPQDPSDEPAEKLLERIKEERKKSMGEKDINRKRKNKPRQLELSTYVK